MQSQPTDRTEALPAHFAPLARVIAGRAPVTMSSGPASRAALAAVGKQAATVGRVIHLDRPPDSSARTVEIMAHELVHAARPSAQPRFFDDEHRDDEEHQATRTGKLLRALGSPQTWGETGTRPFQSAPFGRDIGFASVSQAKPSPRESISASGRATASPAARSSRSLTSSGSVAFGGTDGLAVSGPRAFSANVSSRVARRTPTGSDSSGKNNAPEPLVPPRRPRPSGGSAPIQRNPGSLFDRFREWFSGPPDTSVPNQLDELQSVSFAGDGVPLMSDSAPMSSTRLESSIAADSKPVELSPDTIDRIVEAVEERVIQELERRGLRHNPGVF